MKIIGHRGLPETYPENTLLSLRQALAAGADGVECDVQFSREGRPYLLHDQCLQRVAGRADSIADLSHAQLVDVSVHEPRRFGERFYPYPIEALEQILPLLGDYPQATCFVEIKPESLASGENTECRVSIGDAVAQVRRVFRDHLNQLVLISFAYELLAHVRANDNLRIGWVLTRYDDSALAQAQQLQPDFLICDQAELPGDNLWQGPWQWFAYDIVSLDRLRELEQLGVQWVESWNVAGLLQDLQGQELADGE